MRIEEARPENVAYVAARMRDADSDEFMAVSTVATREELEVDLTERFGDYRGSITAFLGPEPVAIGAMVEWRPNVATLCFFATPAFPLIALDLTRFIRQRLFPTYKRTGFHRIECASMAGYDKAHRWIEILGLKREAVMPGYGRDGQTFIQFSWVADVRAPGA